MVDLFPRRPAVGRLRDGLASRCRPAFCAAPVRGVRSRVVASGAPGAAVLRRRRPVPRYTFRLPRLLLCKGAELGGAPNVTALTLRAGQAAHLAGYLSGLMEARRTLPQGGRHLVSIISGEPGFPQQQVLVQGFSTGVRRSLPGVEIRTDYSGEYDNQAPCERIANRQIDAGSGVVFATAGDCGLGALSAAALRGVWGVASSEDRSHLGPHVLASASNRFDRLVELSVSWYLEGRLPPGGDVELGLVDDAVALVGINPDVPPLIRGKVAQEAARLRAQEARQPRSD